MFCRAWRFAEATPVQGWEPVMPNERLFDVDLLTGARTYFSYEEGARESDDIFVLRRQVDLEPVVELNKYEYNVGDHSAKKFFAHRNLQ